MPRMSNGIGTRYLGASDRHDDGSFVTTEWFVLFYVPLLPLKSQRVVYIGDYSSGGQSIQSYSVREPAPLDKRLVGIVYAWLFVPLALAAVILSIGSGATETIRSVVSAIMLIMLIACIVFWDGIFPSRYKAK